MSKQDIEKRLGFAAQGVKETTRTSAKAEFIRFIDLETWKDSKGTVFTAGIEEDSGNRFQPYVTARDSSGGDQLRTLNAPVFKTEKGARKWLNTWMQNNKSTSARPGVKAKFGRFNTEFGFLANQIKNQPDLAKKNIIVLAKKMGKEVDITRAEFEQLMQYAAKLGMETQVANAHDDVRPGFSRAGAKAKFVRIVTTPQGRYTTNLDKNTRAPIEGGKGYVMVDPAQYITPKRVRVQGTKGEIEVQAIVEGKEIVGVSAKLVSARSGAKAKMATAQRSGEFDQAKAILRQVASGFDIESLKEQLVSAKDVARIAPKYKDVGQKLIDGINMVVSAVKQMKAESMKAARPGVKAEFDLTGMELYNRIVPTINILGRFWGVQAPRFKQNIADAAKYAKKAFDLGEKIFQSNTASPQEIREFERQVSVAKAQPGWRIANSENFSRPGVKAKMGSSQVNDSATTADLIREAQRLRDVIKTSNREFDKTHLRQIKQELDRRGVLMPYGASEVLASRPGVKAKMETPMRVALTPMHTRAEQGYENFIAVLMKFGGITREQALKAFKAFKDAKVLVTKEQYMGGGITVKHGAFMERDVIRRAAGLPEESPRPGVKAKMAAEIASDPRDKDFEKLKTLKGVVHQGKGFYIIPGKLMTPERRTKVKRSTQRYELSNMGDLVGWGTNHPNVNDYRLKDWAEAFA